MRTNRSKHPWSRWLDGNEHALIPGKDFRKFGTLRRAAYRAASVRGIKVLVCDLGERVLLKVKR
jgi:hypothetical protein